MNDESIYIILYGNGDWESHDGTLESAKERARESYNNYGHINARVIEYKLLWFIRDELVEDTKDVL